MRWVGLSRAMFKCEQVSVLVATGSNTTTTTKKRYRRCNNVRTLVCHGLVTQWSLKRTKSMSRCWAHHEDARRFCAALCRRSSKSWFEWYLGCRNPHCTFIRLYKEVICALQICFWLNVIFAVHGIRLAERKLENVFAGIRIIIHNMNPHPQ